MLLTPIVSTGRCLRMRMKKRGEAALTTLPSPNSGADIIPTLPMDCKSSSLGASEGRTALPLTVRGTEGKVCAPEVGVLLARETPEIMKDPHLSLQRAGSYRLSLKKAARGLHAVLYKVCVCVHAVDMYVEAKGRFRHYPSSTIHFLKF